MKTITTFYPLTITNTLTGAKELFKPIVDKQALLYVCGITPYDYAHLGHGRCYTVFDLLFRLLQVLEYEVTYCRNFTDIDDKLLARAQAEVNDQHAYPMIATKFINAFHEDMASLNCLTPTFEPRVTERIPEIISFIEHLIAKGNAYVVAGDVYYSIETFPEYGKLSKRDLSDLVVGARVQVREDKRSPFDFALWKKDIPGNPGWQSPWGWGRPGWHIECSALANHYLSQTIDIHGGGMDLIFPHHENEIAQSEGLHHKPLAHYWVHNAFVIINKEKMSKSLGNFFTLRQVFEHYDPMVVRYYLLNHHYRHPLEFSFTDLDSFAKSYQRLSLFFKPISLQSLTHEALMTVPLLQKLMNALCDDLNVAKFFGILFDNLSMLSDDQEQAGIVKALVQTTLGLSLEPLAEQKILVTPEIQELIVLREQARLAKDWAQADALREQLRALGFMIQDHKIT